MIGGGSWNKWATIEAREVKKNREEIGHSCIHMIQVHNIKS